MINRITSLQGWVLIYGKSIMEIVTSYHFSPELDSESLEEIYEGDLDYALCMFQTYVETLGDELILLQQVKEKKEVVEIRKIVHKVKPNFSMVGLPKLYHAAVKLEKLCDKDQEMTLELQQSVEDFHLDAQNSLAVIDKEVKLVEQFIENE